ncbi:MAG: hypothetical protein GF405_08890, partial [Candidatus Eisenbacteria bacterium]|nr:hypothetical protein [Candidatus Eisenbacteria bacterium]
DDLAMWEDPGGRWHMQVDREMTEEQKEEVRRLRSIGYLAGQAAVPEVAGVTEHDPERAWNGLNFYTSGDFPGAVLMDMEGNILHRWEYAFIDAWRANPVNELPKNTKGAGFWRRAFLYENGDVLGIYDGMGLVKVDKDSRLIWSYLEGAHHDLEVAEDGRIYVLVREAHIVPRVNPHQPILEDFVVVLDPDGTELERTSVVTALENSTYDDILASMRDSGDILHTNTVELLDGRLASRVPGFEAGNVMICPRELDAVLVMDLERESVVWATTAPWVKPHQPTVLENGDILIFDNRGNGGASRVIQFDPVTRDITWLYATKDPWDFFSNECGSNQRLPNGNTLITESDRGRAFEVTPRKEIVWEYVNPAQVKDDEGHAFIASIFEMLRLPPDFPTDWLESE